jgi:phenylalanine-4-hydroxylase
MSKGTKYISKIPNKDGVIEWSVEENLIWHELYFRQLACIKDKACDEYRAGLDKLQLPTDRIPQLSEISAVLKKSTGWQCYPVPALIGFGEFFRLLSEKKFPVATFIRSREEMDYLREPDIFHEIFGHCPLLTNSSFANYTEAYGKMGLNASKEQRIFLARLYWFTIEFGLLDTPKGLKIYGGGILSSPRETEFAINNKDVTRQAFNILDVLRTPYRIDIMQPIYYMLSKVSDLDEIRKFEVEDIMELVAKAEMLGLHEAKFSRQETS